MQTKHSSTSVCSTGRVSNNGVPWMTNWLCAKCCETHVETHGHAWEENSGHTRGWWHLRFAQSNNQNFQTINAELGIVYGSTRLPL